MALETGTYINDLVASNPPGSDSKATADDHLRLIKTCVRNSLPGLAGPVNRVTGRGSAYTLLATDNLSVSSCTGTFTLSLTAAATLGNGFTCWVLNMGSGVITIDPNGSEVINGTATITLQPDEGAQILCDGTSFAAIRGFIDVGAAGAALLQGATMAETRTILGITRVAEVGVANVYVGNTALDSLTSGEYNTAIGYNALTENTSGGDNTAVGASALSSNTTGYDNTAHGSGALGSNTTGYNNTAVGRVALVANTSGADNTSVGRSALSSNTTGNSNTAIGSSALAANTTGYSNTATGYTALAANTTGYSNTATGTSALNANTTGYYNTATGTSALSANTTGNYNTATGYTALSANTTGFNNTATGTLALYANTTGSYNTAIGDSALYSNTTGYNNIATGASALNANTTGYYNTATGYGAGSSATTGSNNSFLGYNAQPSSATVSNEITLGNSSIATLRCQVTTITALSDERDKKNIEVIPLGLDFVLSLLPRRFTWNMRDGARVGQVEGGFIAQELQIAQRDHGAEWLGLVYDSNPDKLEASPGKLIPVLVRAVQELAARVKELEGNASR
jgi:hypothetical protein